jgi:hypothetical protein
MLETYLLILLAAIILDTAVWLFLAWGVTHGRR